MELRNAREQDVVRSDANWGFCQDTCVTSRFMNSKFEINYLQEAKLSLLSNPECQIKGQNIGVDIHKEICAWKKNNQRVRVYRRRSDGRRFKRLRR